MTGTDQLRYALAAAARGWHVFPIAYGDKVPLKGWPWKEHTTTDPSVIRRFWTSGAYNIGIATGPSRLVVVDLDKPKLGESTPPKWAIPGVNDGADVLAVLCERAGQPLPFDTFTVTTRRGGLHLYFTAPDGATLGNTSGDKGNGLGWLIDTRAVGGYVVGPGSFVDLEDGTGPYEVIRGGEVAPLPEWLAVRLTPRTPETMPATQVLAVSAGGMAAGYARAALQGEVERVFAAAPGTRNHTLNTAAFALGQLIAGGLLPRHLVESALQTAAESIGLTSREAFATIRSGIESGHRQPRRGAAA